MRYGPEIYPEMGVSEVIGVGTVPPSMETPISHAAMEVTTTSPVTHFLMHSLDQWELQDPKMEVLYHIRPYFVGIFPYIGLKNRPYIW